ncbi:MAG: ASPIC/UnbV domain-containing protein [Chloroflexi bacterium]|nr:ASPIC/UnbV domain-containing protein [Chloroflexota bacterium]
MLGSSSFLSMSSLDLNFGLGVAEQIDKLIIRWPSGVVQELSGLKANQVHEILEPRS